MKMKVLKVDDDSKELYTEKKRYSDFNNPNKKQNQLFTYQPLNPSLLELPLVGETVELVKVGNVKYYRKNTKY